MPEVVVVSPSPEGDTPPVFPGGNGSKRQRLYVDAFGISEDGKIYISISLPRNVLAQMGFS